MKQMKNIKNQVGLKGVVTITRINKKTGKKEFLVRKTNTITISGYQWILLKMFNLHLDSSHATPYDDIGQDSTLIIPDLNNSGKYQLGVDPNNYTPMNEDILSSHSIQGFMIGNGGSGEDGISSKNTDYSFIKLRNPIPFQQVSNVLSSDIAGQYLGVLRNGTSSVSKSFYIKKFDSRPHIYHSWWKNGQRWDYVDPVTQNSLGPDAEVSPKQQRIETYIECKMSISDTDCAAYFGHEGNTQTAAINELGLVAFDTVNGVRSIIENMYNQLVKRFIGIIFDKENESEDNASEAVYLAEQIYEVMNTNNIVSYGHTNINSFITLINNVKQLDSSSFDFDYVREQLSSDTNINVEAFYSQNNKYVYEVDKFLEYFNDPKFDALSTDEAQRIKLITYYTFNTIPIQSDSIININYRIYAN